MRALRIIAAALIGMLVANLTIFGWEWLLPALRFVDITGLDGMDSEYVLRTGALGAQLAIVAGWTLGAGVGAFAAFALGRSDWTGWVVPAWVAVLTFGLLLMYPFALWLRLAAVAGPFVGALFAFGLYRRWRAARLHLRQPR